MNNPLGVSPSKWNQEPHEVQKKKIDLGGNRAHDLRIRSTVTLPKVGLSLSDLVAQSAEQQ